jgi:hypothetical protein
MCRPQSSLDGRWWWDGLASSGTEFRGPDLIVATTAFGLAIWVINFYWSGNRLERGNSEKFEETRGLSPDTPMR